MDSTETIRPLKDVWLRPRRVFRALAAVPIGFTDYALAAALGTGNFLALFRAQGAGAHHGIAAILGESVAYGTVAGITSLFLMAMIYRGLGTRAGGKASFSQVVHVLAYGSVPMAASLGLWLVSALLAGEAAFMTTPKDLDGFPAFLLHMELAAYALLYLWSVVLQVMGLSEIQSFGIGKAFGVWLLGQLIGVLASIFLAQVLDLLLSGSPLNLGADH